MKYRTIILIALAFGALACSSFTCSFEFPPFMSESDRAWARENVPDCFTLPGIVIIGAWLGGIIIIGIRRGIQQAIAADPGNKFFSWVIYTIFFWID